VIAESPSRARFRTRTSGNNNDLQGSFLGTKSSLGKLLRWVKVNECTWKLTDGEKSLTPASHGQWGGYHTEKAVAWVIEVGWPFGKTAWYARCGGNSYGPTDFNTAKKAALAFVTNAPPPECDGARAFTGRVNLHADPDAERNRRDT
jgi:hypothetical protein